MEKMDKIPIIIKEKVKSLLNKENRVSEILRNQELTALEKLKIFGIYHFKRAYNKFIG